MRERLPLPEAIKNAPTLSIGLEFYIESFYELNTCRTKTFDIGNLTWLTIDEYCSRNEIAGDDREDFHQIIKSMDDAYLDYCKSKKSKSTKK